MSRVELSVRCDLSVRLAALVEAGELDLAIAKRVATRSEIEGTSNWRVLRREQLVWFAGEGSNAIDQQPLPLAVFQEGCVIRMAAIAALAGSGVPWRAAFVGSSFTALRHAVGAGIAITPLPRSLATAGLIEIREGLPSLPDTELISRFGPGEMLSAARSLEKLFESRI